MPPLEDPGTIRTISSHEEPTTILHVQKSAPKQTHSQHATPSRDPIMPSNHAQSHRPTKQTPHKSTKPKSPPQAVLKVLARLKYSVPLYKAESGFSILAEECLTFRTITPYNVSSRALAAILSPSLSVYFTSIGRYFFSSFTLPEDLAMRTRFLIAVRSSGLIFNTLL